MSAATKPSNTIGPTTSGQKSLDFCKKAIQRFIKGNQVIEQKQTTFFECGKALSIIKENSLYPFDFDTFEAYCKEEWGLKRIRVHQYISGAKAIEGLPEEIRSQIKERAARELVSVDPKHLAEVIRRVLAKSKRGGITSISIRKVKDEMSLEERETEIGEKTKILHLDKNSVRIPEEVKRNWAKAENDGRFILRKIQEARVRVDELLRDNDKLLVECKNPLGFLSAAYKDLRSILPHVVCPSCMGERGRAACKICGGRGFVSEAVVKRAIEKAG